MIIIISATELDISAISGFATYMLELPWDKFAESYRSKNFTELFKFYETVILHLVPFLVKPPNVPINASCSPPPRPSPATHNNYCTALKTEPKIGILIQSEFDADVLEIHFRELCDIVENFFIIEFPKGYFRGLSKPLLWPLLKEQDRFAFCKDKVVHFLLDSDVVEEMKRFQNGNRGNNDYTLENLQEKKRWEKFLVWNNVQKVFKDGDLLGMTPSDFNF